MSFKKIIIILLVPYGIYFMLISTGFIKKDFIVENESASSFQKFIALITPLSPEEKDVARKDKEVKSEEKLAMLRLQLSLEEENLQRYEEWRMQAETNPPT